MLTPGQHMKLHIPTVFTQNTLTATTERTSVDPDQTPGSLFKVYTCPIHSVYRFSDHFCLDEFILLFVMML